MSYLFVGSLSQGGLIYQGTWDANANNPSLTSGVGTKGSLYVVSVDGTTNLDGINQWYVGDWAVFNGLVWNKIDGQSSQVVSVAGRTGAVVLGASDIVSGTFASALLAGAYTGITQVGTLSSLAVTAGVSAGTLDLSSNTIKFSGNAILVGDGASNYFYPQNNTTGSLYFYTNNTNRLQIDASGNIKIVGAITQGAWRGSAVAPQYGGTGSDLSATSGYLKQVSSGANVTTSATIPTGDITGLAAVATSGSASDLSTGTLATGRLTGAYTGITGVGTLGSLIVTNGITSVNGDITSGGKIVATGNLGGANFTHYGVDVAEVTVNPQRRAYFVAQMNGTIIDPALYTSLVTGTVAPTFIVGSLIQGAQSASQYKCSTTTGTTNQAGVGYNTQVLPGWDYAQFHGRVDGYIAQLSNSTDSFYWYMGVCQTNGAREHLDILYSHDLNGGKFQLRTNFGANTVDTGVTVQANTVYSFDYYCNVTTPGSGVSNPFIVTITDKTNNTAPVVLTGNMICGNVTGASLDTGSATFLIKKRAGTTPCLAYMTYMMFDGVLR